MAASTNLCVLLVVCVMVQSSYQLQCYSCIEDYTKQRDITIPGLGITIPTTVCPAEFTGKTPSATCGSNEVCLKYTYEGDAHVRSCGTTKICDQLEDCWSCNADMCNSASSTSIALFVLAVPALLWRLC